MLCRPIAFVPGNALNNSRDICAKRLAAPAIWQLDICLQAKPAFTGGKIDLRRVHHGQIHHAIPVARKMISSPKLRRREIELQILRAAFMADKDFETC